MLTLADMILRLKQIDEISLLEVLDIDAEELVDRFTDKIEERYDQLYEEFVSEEAESD